MRNIVFRVIHVVAVLLTIIFIAVSCKPSIPGNYLSPKKMTDLLYDFYLASEITKLEQTGDTLTNLYFKISILEKHGVTEAQFDSSLVYYCRHTNHLQGVYNELFKRFSEEAMLQGMSESELNRFAGISSSSDTASIWNGETAFVLTPYAATNHYLFNIPADSSFHKGDRVMLDFNARFVHKEDLRDGIVILALKLSNDSVTSKAVRISSSKHYLVQVEDRKGKGIKEVKGYFLVTNDASADENSTLRMLMISNIEMIRMHVAENANKAKPVTKTDSVSISDTAKVDTALGTEADLSRTDTIMLKQEDSKDKSN